MHHFISFSLFLVRSGRLILFPAVLLFASASLFAQDEAEKSSIEMETEHIPLIMNQLRLCLSKKSTMLIQS